MKLVFIFTLIFLIKIPVSFSQKQSSNLSDLAWLLGDWQMNKKNGLLSESWQQIDDSTFQESSYMQKNSGEKILLEKVQIVARRNELYYIPTVADQNNQQPVKFRITTISKEAFTAENAEHDFPKRIFYKIISHDSLYARIDGGTSMPEKKSDFYYSRQKK
ncbi:MAG: DUF6265 family protein [Ginsengibacter sp.]